MTEPCVARIAEENVLIQEGDCAIVVLPEYGGKIASIRIGERELLQSPLCPIAPRTAEMTFDAGDASGWDECFPSVAAATVETAEGPVQVPDHGDLWRVGWLPTAAPDGSSVSLRAQGFSLPLTLDRILELNEKAYGWSLQASYTVTNTGTVPAPWSWAAHPLFTVETGDRILLPESIQSLRLEGSGGGRLGPSGASVPWPIAPLASGGATDLSEVHSAESGTGDKLFAGPLKPSENWCALERPSVGIRIRFQFDPEATPYLGLWICYGGWPERPGPKQMCVALEPCTAPVDSLAVSGPWSRTLLPGQSYSWPMSLDFEFF